MTALAAITIIFSLRDEHQILLIQEKSPAQKFIWEINIGPGKVCYQPWHGKKTR